MASFTVPCSKASALAGYGSSTAQKNWHQNHIKQNLPLNRRGFFLKDSFLFGSSLVDPSFSGIEVSNKKRSAGLVMNALNEVVGKTSNSSAALVSTPGNVPSRGEMDSAVAASDQNSLPDELSISTFMSQVSDLIKLVDSRDIMELELKQRDCEIIIRKKEALQPLAPAPAPAPSPYMALPPPQAHSMVAPPPTPARAAAAPASSPSAAPKVGSSHPPLKCPMAGTFYRSPAPGEPPFVKVGDKVQKGQIICIIEAMKLMNEIEADKSGTIAEILAEDGKPVSIDTALLVIAP